MSLQIKPLVEINQKAIRLLYRELGVVDAVRFLQQFGMDYGDYTEERRQLFGHETLEAILHEIATDNAKNVHQE